MKDKQEVTTKKHCDNKEIGKRIQELRKLNGITQERLASMLNLNVDHMCRVETGKRGCSLDILVNIADIFEVSLDYLIRGKTCVAPDTKKKLHSIIAELTALEKKM